MAIRTFTELTPYATPEEGDEYFANRLGADIWFNASYDDKNKALIMATQAIDHLKYQGVQLVEGQSNEFPRDLWPITPDDIKFACFEIAIRYLDGADVEQEMRNLNVESRTYAQVKTVWDRKIWMDALRAGIVSFQAWFYLRPYLADPYTISTIRV
jgi:hypothetical protein